MRTKPPDLFTWQTPFELEQMVAIFDRAKPKRSLEIGVHEGGTLWHWLRRGSTVVAIDAEMRYPDAWQEWAGEAGAKLSLLQGLSQDPAIVEQARQFAPFDFVLIDGDHSYPGVLADWEHYGPMVRPGGIVCFHDIMGEPVENVPRLWHEIKTAPGSQTVEIMGELDCRGIGVVWMP